MKNVTCSAFAGAVAAALVHALTITPALAGDRREAGRHEHGTGELSVAIDGNDVEVELEGPAANFIGFEYQPSTAAEQQALDAALATLREPGQLLAWPAAAGCQLVSAEVTPPDYGEAEENGDHGDPHDGEADDDHAGEVGHSEIAALYAYRCSKPGSLDALRVLVFERFPQTERLAAGVAGPGGQTGATLTPAATVLKLRP
jgi:hypothetical protein